MHAMRSVADGCASRDRLRPLEYQALANSNLPRTITILVAIVALTAVLMLIASALRGAQVNRGALVAAFVVLGFTISRLARRRR